MPFINEVIEENQRRVDLRVSPKPVSRFQFDPELVVDQLRSRIVGQDAVIDAMDDMLHTVKADIGQDQRPLAISLLLGPTGVGKTETVRILTEAIHGSVDKLCRIDMNTLSQSHYAASLTGAPPGYVGSKEGQTLLDVEAIQGSFGKPGIVLFDELEKASPEVIRALLNVLDNGRLKLTAGTREIDFRNSLVFMTSNLGATDAAARLRRYQQGWRRWLDLPVPSEEGLFTRALHDFFEPEFLNRIDRICLFHRLGPEFCGALMQVELEKLQARLKRRGVVLQVDEPVRTWLAAGYDIQFGARDIARRIRKELEPAIARAMLNEPMQPALVARLDNGKIRVGAA